MEVRDQAEEQVSAPTLHGVLLKDTLAGRDVNKAAEWTTEQLKKEVIKHQ